jgi:5-methylcytosine-specific restriction enzyme subunit McrC
LSTLHIVDAREYEETDIPVSELWTDGKLELLPEILGRGFFQIRFSRDRLVFFAGQYVGLIPLNSRLAINVQPKTPVPNLLRLLGRSQRKIQSLAFFPTNYEPASALAPSFLEPVASTLASQLRKLEVSGLYKDYLERNSDDPPLRGRIRFARSARFWSAGLNYKAAVSFHELTPDLLPNRVLRTCLDHLLLQSRVIAGISSALKRELTGYQQLFVAVGVSQLHPHDIERAKQEAQSLSSVTYREAVNLGILILEGRGIKLPGGAGFIKLPSFLIDMADTFESYIRETLQKKLNDLRVLDGNREGSRSFYNEKREPPATPDIVVRGNNRDLLVGDVKYKISPAREDINQVLAYALRYGSAKALLVCFSGSLSNKLELLGTVGDIRVYRYAFPLSASDLDHEEQELADAVRGICSESL